MVFCQNPKGRADIGKCSAVVSTFTAIVRPDALEFYAVGINLAVHW